jgi:hypothetical protein
MLNGAAGGYWYSFDDAQQDGGASTVAPGNDPDEFFNNIYLNGALVANFNLGAGFDYPYATVAFDWVYTEMGAAKLPANLSGKTGLCITYQGSGVSLNMTQTNQIGYDSYTATLPTTNNRTTVEIPFSRFAQKGWGDTFPQDLTSQEALQFWFTGTAGTTGSLSIYEIGFYGSSPFIPTSSSSHSSSSSYSSSSFLVPISPSGLSGSIFSSQFPSGQIMLNGIAGGYWYSFDDTQDGGASTVTPGNEPDEFLNNITLNNALLANFNLGPGFDYPYAGVVFDWVYADMGAAKLPANLSGKTGFCITYQGFGVSLNMTQTNQVGYDSYTTPLPSSATPTTIQIPFSRFAQEGWGDAFPQDLYSQESLQFQFKGTAGTTGYLIIYSIGFTGEC